MTAPSDDQKLANERTDHLGRPRGDKEPNGDKEPSVPKESFEQGSRDANPVEREGVPRKQREGDIERV